jgi:Pyruvate/2-oxoacid:ferredoxin oxidoreductase delta subunit
MDLDYFIQYTVLEIVCFIFIIGFIFRIVFFVFSIIRGSRGKEIRLRYILTVSARALLPFHMAAAKKPFYALVRYVFHAILIVVPVWYSGHIYLWDQYGIEGSITALPDGWVDGFTLLLLSVSAYFLLRRMLSKNARRNATISDYLLITLAAMPFLSGYLLARDTLAYVPFLGDHMASIHVLTAEAMILMTAFLFCRVRLDESPCTGCAACELNCPTGALTAEDRGSRRVFTYALYQCICCGSCVRTCTEYAAELRHFIGGAGYFKMLSRQTIRSVEISACKRCGALFAPDPQIVKLRETIKEDYLLLCLRCKRETAARRCILP